MYRKIKQLLVATILVITCMPVMAQQDSSPIQLGSYRRVESRILNETRKLLIHLPEGYEETKREYPVLYLLDSAWTPAFAGDVSTVEELSFEKIPEMIVVGIAPTYRWKDMSPLTTNNTNGRAEKFRKFLQEEVFSFIEREYRAADFRILYGASISGMFVTETFLKTPEMFNAYIISSPTYGYVGDYFAQLIEDHEISDRNSTKVYLEYGELDMKVVLDSVPVFIEKLENKIKGIIDFQHNFVADAGHVPESSLANGLIYTFNYVKEPLDVSSLDMEAVNHYYAEKSQRYGFSIIPPRSVYLDLSNTVDSEDKEGVISVLSKMVKDYPTENNGHYYLAKAYRDNGDLENAIIHYKKAMKYWPGFTPAIDEFRDTQIEYHKKLSSEFSKIPNIYMGQKPPGSQPQVFSPGIVSLSDRGELNPIYSPNGKEFFFTERLKIEGYHYRVWVMKLVNGSWTRPSLASFNSKDGAVDVGISLDGNNLYFAAEGEIKSENYLHMVYRKDDDWSAPENMGDNFAYAMYPSFTYSGRMYFAADRTDGKGQKDIYYSDLIDGVYQPSVILGDDINTKHGEGDTYVAPDESYMIINSWGRSDSLGRGDLYVSFKSKDGNWTKPINLGAPINTENTEFCPWVTPDGNYLFYSSAGEIYWVDTTIIRKLKEESLTKTNH